jgi:hypothetical protein
MDWTFASADTREGTHGIHPYPAKFIPQIPQALIAALHPGDRTAVMDPFCGSGTTLVEAARVDLPAVGVDLHPLACLITKVKLTPVAEDLGSAAARIVSAARTDRRPPPEIPALDHWFRPDIQMALAGLARAIDAERDADVSDALRIALSSIVVRVSNQESDTRYAAIEKSVRGADVLTQFVRAAAQIGRALTHTWRDSRRHRTQVLNRDILSVSSTDIKGRVSLVVTSPPYPNAYEYWLYHKYRMYWLGMDPIAVRNKEIGARPNYFRRNPATAADFEQQMGSVFALLSDVMTDDGHACFQVGNSVIRGELIDNAALLKRAAAAHGFAAAAEMRRAIPQHRKAFNAAHARIKTEDLIVFKRGHG